MEVVGIHCPPMGPKGKAASNTKEAHSKGKCSLFAYVSASECESWVFKVGLMDMKNK